MKRTLVSLALMSVVAVSFADPYQFRITVDNLGPQPLSPLFWSAGNSNFDIFQLGNTASAGIKAIAEGGNTAPMSAIAASAGSDVASDGTIAGGPVGPGGSRTVLFTTDMAHPYFSFAAMLGKTNDGFIGESYSSSGLNLFHQGAPQNFTVLVNGLRAWDAGTEMNTQNAAGFLGGMGNPPDSNHAIRIHDSVLQGVGDSYALMPDWNLDTPLARVSVQAVPEPASILALGLGAAALIRKRRQMS